MRVAKRRPRTLYTIGHSTRTYDELVAVLAAWGVTTLVDIRRFTRSRAHPHLNGEMLARRLPGDGITYFARPELGGRRGPTKSADESRNAGWQVAAFRNYADYADTEPFVVGLDWLLARAEETTCAIMCAEMLWWRCHRRIVADHVLARGVPVVHIFTSTKAQPAELTPFARTGRRRGGVRYPLTTAHA